MLAAAHIYATVHTDFGLWDRIPEVKLDDVFHQYLVQAIATDRRYDFDLATLALIGRLRSGHTWFDDAWLEREYGAPLGFTARVIGQQWVVSRSGIRGLQAGDVIQTIDGRTMDAFYETHRPFISGSNERETRDGLFQAPYLFPQRFTLHLSDGRDVGVDRSQRLTEPVAQVESRWIVKDQVRYIRLPSFGDASVGVWARDQVNQFRHAAALIIDVRGNLGGMAGPTSEVQAALLGTTRARWRERTPARIGRLEADGAEQSELSYERAPPIQRFQAAPDSAFYTGRVVILMDGECTSSCEDFVMPFKGHPRATLVGDTTAGTFSQTVHSVFGGMIVSIATTEVYFTDRSQFEGIGVAPDILVRPTIADLKEGRDPVLARAVEVIAANR